MAVIRPHIMRSPKGSTPVGSLEAMLQDRDAMLDDLQVNLMLAQQRMKYFATRTALKWSIKWEIGCS